MDPPETSHDTERRHATVMFADLTGFTAMASARDPEEVYSIVSGCVAFLDAVVRRHGGRVDKYLGDCVMGVFGAPFALEGASRAAVNAAIEMRQRVAEYSREQRLSEPLEIHVGIESGLVISGDVTGPVIREFAVVGDAVNRASRIKDAAPPGKVYVGLGTWRETQGEFDYRALEPVRVKGKPEPLPVFELLSERKRSYRTSIDPTGRMFAPLVGRDEELERLRAALSRALGGSGGLVALLGEPGLGKSRLVLELCRSAEAARAGVLAGRCLPSGSALAYHPFADLFRGFAGIAEGEEERASRERLELALRREIGDQTPEELPFACALLGLRPDAAGSARLEEIVGEAMGALLQRSVRSLLTAVAARRPLLLMIEDVHWADLSSIELLEALLPVVREAPILVLATARPGHGGAAARLLERAGVTLGVRAERIELGPLSALDGQRLLANLLRGAEIPPALRAAIGERGGGNPFYLEEIVRSLLEQGALEEVDGAVRPTGRIEEAAVPATLRDAILARVDRLEPRRKGLLQLASVLGRSFDADALREMADEPAQLGDDLEALAALQLLEFAGDWQFEHALIQEVVYDTLLRARREALHRRVGEVLERRGGGRPGASAQLAYHFGRAGDLARAERHLLLAGEEAARSAASNEALQHFQEAARLYRELHGGRADPEKHALLEKRIAVALDNRGRGAEAVAAYDRALAVLGEKVPKRRAARSIRAARAAAGLLVDLYLGRPGRRRPAASDREREVFALRLRRAFAETTAAPDRFLPDALEVLATLRRFAPETLPRAGGTYAALVGVFSYGGFSFRIGGRALDVAATLVDPQDAREVALYRFMRFAHCFLAGDFDDGHVVDDATLDEQLRLGELFHVVTYLGFEAERQICKGRWREAEAALARLGDIADRYAYEPAGLNRLATTAVLHLERGELSDAALCAEGYYARSTQDALGTLALSLFAKVALLRGEIDQAEDRIARARALVRGSRWIPPYHRAQLACAELLLAVRRLEQARAAGNGRVDRPLRRRARRAGREAVSLGAKVAARRPESYRLAGSAAWLLGRRRGAVRLWEDAASEAQRLGARPELARTKIEAGGRLGEAGGTRFLGREAEAHLREGTSLLAELGIAE